MLALLILFLSVQIKTIGQNNLDQSAVMNPIRLFFNGMLTADSSKVSSTIAKHAKFFTVTEQNGEPIFQEGSIANFLNTIGGIKPGFFKEVISNEKISIDGKFASVWCDYQFYLGDQLHHCGVNQFLLINTSQGWKIRQATDTRRAIDCNE